MKESITKLERTRDLSDAELLRLLDCTDPEARAFLFSRARSVRERVYGSAVYTRGLIEFTNHCKNDCLYCGIRRGNPNPERYRLTPEEILACTDNGYALGFRTFVLQGGEDLRYTDDVLCALIRAIKERHPDCAVTLSIGEKSRESYAAYYAAGADRYLLRHETASAAHYARLHPPEMSFDNRMRCLRDLKDIGYQVGCGMMVGSPFQTPEDLLKDLRFLQRFQPHMVGIGPFIPQHDTPLGDQPAGTLELTLLLLSIIRLLLPNVLLPATTALGTIHPRGRELGLQAGANVVMPNLSPTAVRKNYLLYDNKICTDHEAAECIGCLRQRVAAIGFELVVDRGDHRA
ncbi:MAG: [Oscillospiraceae bacterium]|nr:[FeFe] hydrogenase H-cluster radical SAM maturase HydE [Oscillospiraceae bacterium]